MEQQQKLTAWRFLRKLSRQLKEIKNKRPLAKSRRQDNRQDNQYEAAANKSTRYASQGPLQHMHSPGKATSNLTTGYLNQGVWIHGVSWWKTERVAGI